MIIHGKKDIRTPYKEAEAFMKAMTDALAERDISAARRTMGDVKFGEGGKISYQGKDLDIMDNNKKLEQFAENLENCYV